jgi:hypothetical protein
MTAVVLPLLLGFAAFGVEVSGWYLKQRAMQGAADAAAISAASAYLAGGDWVAEGKNYSHLNSWTDGSNQVTVSVTPTTIVTDHIDVDISQPQASVLSRFLHISTSSPTTTIRAHSRASVSTIQQDPNGCIIGLSFTAAGGAIQISGQGQLNAPTCTIASNTNTAAQATSCLAVTPPCMTFSGANTSLNVNKLQVATLAPFVCPAGTAGIRCKVGTIANTYPLWTRDPYATRTMPTPPTCPANDPSPITAGGVTTYQPGVYCRGISISGQKYVNFNSGIYFLGGADNSSASSLSISGTGVSVNLNLSTVASAALTATLGSGYKTNDTVTVAGGTAVAPLSAATLKLTVAGGKITGVSVVNAGSYSAVPSNPVSVTGGSGTGAKFNLTFNPPPGGVSFILTGPTAAAVGNVTINSATLNLTAVTGGATDQIIFWQDKKATGGGASFAGSPSSVTFNGTLYFPNQPVSISGNYSFQPTDCTSIVASVVSFSGQGTITKGCLSIGGGSGGGTSTVRISQ